MKCHKCGIVLFEDQEANGCTALSSGDYEISVLVRDNNYKEVDLCFECYNEFLNTFESYMAYMFGDQK